MKRILKIVWVCCTVPLMAFTCIKDEGPDCHQYLDMENASTQEIIVLDVLFYKSWGYPPSDYAILADTYRRIKVGKAGDEIAPGKTVRILDMTDSGMCLESHLNDGNCWIFFILDAEVVVGSTPEELTDGRAILDTVYYYYDDIRTLGPHLIYE